jgi:uncharacterized membrane protein YhiD involved in acid resistance
MENLNQTLQLQNITSIYQMHDVVLNICMAFILGMFVSYVYKMTHKGLSYSQSFLLTIVFVTMIVAMVMMVIGNNVARAFALVGALSIIRFRTVVKDTKDTAFIFLALAAGMAAGTSSYFLAFGGTTIVLAASVILHVTNYGSLYKSEFILRMRVEATDGEPTYSAVLNRYSKQANILHIEPSGDQQTTLVTFDIIMKKDLSPEAFARDLGQVESVSEITLIASKNDMDY